MGKPEYYINPEGSEMIAKLRVTGMNGGVIAPYQKQVMFSLKLDNILPGAIIDCRAYGQVSNPNKFSVNPYGVVSSAIMFCYHTIIGSTPADTSGLWTFSSGQKTLEVTEAKGTNILYEINHQPWVESFPYLASDPFTNLYINQVVYAASAAIGPNSTATYLTVNKDYGRSAVLLWR